MADKAEFKITGQWKKARVLIDAGRFRKELTENIRRATLFNAKLAEKEIRARIRGKRYTANAALTILIKRSKTPLVDESDLFGAVTSQLINERTAFVGISRSVRVGEESAADIAAILHEGASVTVTERMRAMFLLLARVAADKFPAEELTGRAAELAARLGRRIRDIKPLKASTTVIVIPPRPFLRAVIEDSVLLQKWRANWTRAVDSALRGV